MNTQMPLHRVEVRFVGRAPVGRVLRASGVSEVVGDGSTLRCLVRGSVQPFLEALAGYEVVSLTSAQVLPPPATSTRQRQSRAAATADDRLMAATGEQRSDISW